MLYIIVFIILIIIFIVVLKGFSSKENSIGYQMKGPLFTKAERSFLGVLNQACGDKAIIFGMVRIADILKPQKGLNKSQWQTAFNKISAKHFDYVLCNPNDLSVISVVELDDNTHSQKNRISRDNFIEEACRSSSLKLHRFKASHAYNIHEVRASIFPEPDIDVCHSNDLTTEKVNSIITSKASMVCPKCDSELIKKTAQKGKNKGNNFLACSAFPKCRYTEQIEV